MVMSQMAKCAASPAGAVAAAERARSSLRVLLAMTLALVLLAGATAPTRVMGAPACPNGIDTVALQLKWLQQAQFAGYVVGQSMGFYDEVCIQLSIRPGGPNIIVEDEVLSGRAQFGINFVSPLLVARGMRAQNVTLIAQTFARTGMVEVSWRSADIRSPTDLVGRKACVWTGGGNENNLRVALNAFNLTWDSDYRADFKSPANAPVDVVDQAFHMVEFLAGRCDGAAAMRYNELALVLEAVNPATGQLYRLDDLTMIDFDELGVGSMEDGILAGAAWLDDAHHRDIAVRFLAASFKGWAYARDHPDESVQFFVDKSAHQQWQLHEVSKLVWPAGSPDGLGIVPDADLQRAADIALRFGLITNATTTREFYRTDLALEALDLLAASANASPADGTFQWGATRFGPGSADYVYAQPTADFTAPLRFCLTVDGGLFVCPPDRTEADGSWVDWDSGVGIVIAVLCALTLLFSGGVFVLLLVYYNHDVIRAASVRFLLLMCAGGIVALASIWAGFGVPTRDKCVAEAWLEGLGFILMFSAFLVKTWRVERIFGNTRLLSIGGLHDRDLILPMAVLVLVMCALLFVLTYAGDMRVTVEVSAADYLTYRTQCTTDNRGTILACIYCYAGALLLAGVYLAVQTRNVRSDFNESRYLAMSIYNCLVVAVVVVPLINGGIDATPASVFIIKSFGVMLAAAGSIATVFVPKLLIVRDYDGYLKRLKANAELNRSTHTGGSAGRSGVSRSGDRHASTAPILVAHVPVEFVRSATTADLKSHRAQLAATLHYIDAEIQWRQHNPKGQNSSDRPRFGEPKPRAAMTSVAAAAAAAGGAASPTPQGSRVPSRQVTELAAMSPREGDSLLAEAAVPAPASAVTTAAAAAAVGSGTSASVDGAVAVATTADATNLNPTDGAIAVPAMVTVELNGDDDDAARAPPPPPAVDASHL